MNLWKGMAVRFGGSVTSRSNSSGAWIRSSGAKELRRFGWTSKICRPDYDPSARTSFIHAVKDFPGDLAHIAELLGSEELSHHVRSALCVAVGRLGGTSARPTNATLLQLYEHASDGGTTSAARWALVMRGLAEKQLDELRLYVPAPARAGWHVSSVEGITMIKSPTTNSLLATAEIRLMGIRLSPSNPFGCRIGKSMYNNLNC